MPNTLADFATELTARAGRTEFVAGLSLLPYLPEIAAMGGPIIIHVPECFDRILWESENEIDGFLSHQFMTSLLAVDRRSRTPFSDTDFKAYRDSYFSAKNQGRIAVAKFVETDVSFSEKIENLAKKAYSRSTNRNDALTAFIGKFFRQAFGWAHENNAVLVEARDRPNGFFGIVKRMTDLITEIILPSDFLPPDGGIKNTLHENLPPRLQSAKFLLCVILAWHLQGDTSHLVFIAIDP
jgi:hypothetical protein